MSDQQETPQTPIAANPFAVAFINGSRVALVLNTDQMLAGIMTSATKVVDVSTLPTRPDTGWDYDGENFTPPIEQ
jgi:hypothetical protein